MTFPQHIVWAVPSSNSSTVFDHWAGHANYAFSVPEFVVGLLTGWRGWGGGGSPCHIRIYEMLMSPVTRFALPNALMF